MWFALQEGAKKMVFQHSCKTPETQRAEDWDQDMSSVDLCSASL